jgi:hypothetical protein
MDGPLRATSALKEVPRTSPGARGEKEAGKENLWSTIFYFAKSLMSNHWRLSLFTFVIFIWDLANFLICQTNYAKRLGMLLNDTLAK